MSRYQWPAVPHSPDDAKGRQAYRNRLLPTADVRNADGTIDPPRATAPPTLAPPPPVRSSSRPRGGVVPLDAPVGATDVWLPIGPSVVLEGMASGRPTVSGRVRDIRVEPTRGQRVYAAAAGGGVWRSFDRGVSWEALDAFVVSPNRTTLTPIGSALAVGALYVRFGAAVNGGDDLVFMGTGEATSALTNTFRVDGNPGGALTGVGIFVWKAATATVPKAHWELDPGSEPLRGGFVRSSPAPSMRHMSSPRPTMASITSRSGKDGRSSPPRRPRSPTLPSPASTRRTSRSGRRRSQVCGWHRRRCRSGPLDLHSPTLNCRTP